MMCAGVDVRVGVGGEHDGHIHGWDDCRGSASSAGDGRPCRNIRVDLPPEKKDGKTAPIFPRNPFFGRGGGNAENGNIHRSRVEWMGICYDMSVWLYSSE